MINFTIKNTEVAAEKCLHLFGKFIQCKPCSLNVWYQCRNNRMMRQNNKNYDPSEVTVARIFKDG